MIQQHDWKNEGHVQVVFSTGGNQSSPQIWGHQVMQESYCENGAPLKHYSQSVWSKTPQPALGSTKCSFKAERGNIWTPCLWEEGRPDRDVLKPLPWLPTCFRIDLKVLLLVFKCLNGFRSSFLSDLLLPCPPSRMLRSSGAGLCFSPQSEPELWVEPHSALMTHVYGTSGLQRPCVWI